VSPVPLRPKGGSLSGPIERSVLAILVLAAVSTAFSGCFGGIGQRISSPNQPSAAGPTGGVAVKALLTSDTPVTLPIGRVTAVLTRGSQVMEQELAVDPTAMTATGSFPRVLIGTWELEVKVYNQSGDLAYLGAAAVTVQEGKTTSVELPLLAAPGTLIMNLDLSDFASYELVKGRIIIGNGEEPELVREFTRGDSSQVSVQIDRLVPKTHDIRVDVYKNTLHSYNRIYQSPWQTVTIRPGQTTAVNWSPATGCVEIVGYIDAPPPPPAQITAEVQEDGILVSWDPVQPVENDLQGYKVYVQIDPFTGFQLAAVVPSPETYYLYRPQLPSHWNDEIIWIRVAVSSIDKAGNESIRSHSIAVEWPAASTES